MSENNGLEYAVEVTRKLVEDFYPRLTGTDGAVKASNYLLEELDSFCDEAHFHDFTHRPKGFLKFMPIAEIIFLIGVFLLFTKYWVFSILFSGLTVFMFVSQLLFYWGLFDFLFEKEKGRNVYGIIEPSEELRQQIIISGHYDAPYVFHLLEKLRGLYPIVFGLGLVSVLFVFAGALYFDILFLLKESLNGFYFFKLLSIVLSIFSLQFFVFTTSKVSPGAGDDAVAVGIIMSVGKHLSEHRLKHTRIIVLVTDAEEAGLNGARAFLRDNKSLYSGIPTYNFNIDVVYKKEDLSIFARDLNYLVGLSKKEAKIVEKISEKLGKKLPITGMPPGGGSTDSAEFAKAGISSVAIVGLDFKTISKSAYHSSRDDMNALNKEGILYTINLLKEYCAFKDENIESTD